MAFCCLLPLGKLVGGEGSGVIGGQRDQVVEDPGTLVIVVMMIYDDDDGDGDMVPFIG